MMLAQRGTGQSHPAPVFIVELRRSYGGDWTHTVGNPSALISRSAIKDRPLRLPVHQHAVGPAFAG